MANHITVKILSMRLETKECGVEISDNGIVIATGNIGLELNPDGTANTAWIIDTAKGIVLNNRRINLEQESINKITIKTMVLGG